MFVAPHSHTHKLTCPPSFSLSLSLSLKRTRSLHFFTYSTQERKGKKYITLLFTVLGKINTVEPLQYVVALLNELVEGSPDRVLALYTEVSKTMDIYTPLFSFVPCFPFFSPPTQALCFFHTHPCTVPSAASTRTGS